MTDAILRRRDIQLLPEQTGDASPDAIPDTTDMTAEPVKLIYVAGYGRSGTTLLDIALGEHPVIMGAGEITTLARHVWVNSEYCACGASVRECPSWNRIVSRWSQGELEDFVDAHRRNQERTEGLFSSGRWMGRWLNPGRWQDHARQTLKLLRIIRAVSGRCILVDSSKLPGRGFTLAAIPGIDLHVIHVVRDGRGVAWSQAKGHARSVKDGVQRELKPKLLLHSALRWSMVNIAAEILCKRVGPGRSLRVRYEDFVENPRDTIARILALVGEQSHLAGTQAAPFSPQHQVAGSRHRMQKSLLLRGDDKWTREMPPYKQAFVTLMCAPLLHRYGYPLRRGARR